MTNKLNIFSVYSGIIYDIYPEEFALLDDGQIPLTKRPSSCNKCYSRGYSGFNTDKLYYTPCTCINKIVDSARVSAKFNVQSQSA
jgi:hypothetical protein